MDSSRNAKIEVTKGDEATSRKKSHKGCAMAVACKRKFHLDGVIISRNRAYLVKGTQARRFTLPPSVSREVVSFDRGGGFEPGEYQLSKIPEGMKLDRVIKASRPHKGPQTEGDRISLGSKDATE